MRIGDGEWRETMLAEMKKYSPEQISKAKEIFDDFEMRYVGDHMGDYIFTSRDKEVGLVYRTSVWRQSCTCAGAHYGLKCYHLLAAIAWTLYGKGEAPSQLAS